MRRIRVVVFALLSIACVPSAEADERRVRLEMGVLDDRFMMILTQTAPLVQQFTGSTISASWSLATVGLWQGGGLAWTISMESGVSFDSTGLCRWFVRAAEQSTLNSRTGSNDAAPALTPQLVFGMPVYVPIRLRTEVELTVTPGWQVQLGVEAAAVSLFYAADCASVHADAGVTLGTLLWISANWGIGLRLRAISFGDLQDSWPGVGATICVAYAPG